LRPLTIAHFDTERTWRGGEQQVLFLISALKARGHRNLAIVRKGAALAARLRGIADEVFEVQPFAEWDFVTAHFVNRYLRNRSVNVAHAHTGHGVSLAALSTLRTRIPIVLTRRVDFHLSSNPFSKWKYRRASLVIAISDEIKKILIEDGIPADQIRVIPSGVDFRRYSDVQPVDRQTLGVPRDSVIVGQVAALEDHKDQETFVRAMADVSRDVPKAVAVLVGEGSLRRSLDSLVVRLGLCDRVKLLGFQTRPLDYLVTFDVFCLSSKQEGLGTSLLDAMALGIPVVATKAGGIPEIVEDGVSGRLAPPRDPQRLADLLRRAILQPEETCKLRAQALENVKRFDVAQTASLTEQAYGELLKA